MSVAASWLIVAVVLLRFALKKAPKWINCWLWALVAVRLLCPISLESAWSLIPSGEVFPAEVISGPSFDGNHGFMEVVAPGMENLGKDPLEDNVATVDYRVDAAAILGMLWGIGMIAFGIFSIVSYRKIHNKVRPSLHLRKNLWICDDIQTPFIFGILKPRIYIPSGTEEGQLPSIIAHENAHLKRKDHWWKPLGFLTLAIHWFNPLVWIAYILLCRDIELACDEKVVRHLNKAESIAYSEALLSCSVNRRTIMVCPLAFGEVGVKERVKRVLSYKKPAFWIVLASVAICVVLAVCFLTNPYAMEIEAQGNSYAYAGTAELPSGSVQVGTLSREGEYIGNHFDKNHYGVPIYQNDDKSVLYVATSDGFLKFMCIQQDPSVIEWFDYLVDHEGMQKDRPLETNVDSFPGVTFCWSSDRIEAVTDGENTTLLTGMPIWNAFFCDLTGDQKPELCATLSFGSGIIDTRIMVYDYAGGASYTLSDRGAFDYSLRMENDSLLVDKRTYDSSEIVETGVLSFADNCIQVVGTMKPSPTIDARTLDEAVSAAILSHFESGKPDGLLHVENHETLLTDPSNGKGEQISVYLLVLHESFRPDADPTQPLEGVVGDYVPTVITFHLSDAGEYILDEYWEPGDGGSYTDDINEKFPEEALQKVRNGQDYVDALESENKQKALALLTHWGDFDTLADDLLTTICSSPAWSSAPGDYIREHQEEYDKLLQYGEATVRYCFRAFSTGGQTDLRGHIMAALCRDIMSSWGEPAMEVDSAEPTGQAWFDTFSAYARSLAERYSPEDLEAYYPASWLLLQMNGELSDSVDETVDAFTGQDIKIYQYTGDEFEESATVTLYDNGDFLFNFSPISSYIGSGRYTIEDGRLTLKTSDDRFTYAFQMEGDTLVFDADASSDMVWFSDLEDGSVLYSSK